MALGWLWWRAWVPVDAVDAAAVCVAGVVLKTSSVDSAWCGTWRHVRTLLFAWQAVLGDIERAFCVAGVALIALGWLWWRAWVPVDTMEAAAVCAAGVALGDIERRFCVAGAALGDMQAWFLTTSSVDSAWQVRHLATCTYILRGRCGTWRHRASILRDRRGTYGTGLALVARLGPS